MARQYGNISSQNFQTTPKQISNLIAWFDGQDPLGTGVAPANGTAVVTWVDKSVSAINPTQATAAKRATYQTGIINGKGALAFSNALLTQYSNPSTTVVSGLNTYTIYAVCRPNSIANNCTILDVDSASPSFLYVQLQLGGLQLRLMHSTPTGNDNITSANNAWAANTNYVMRFIRNSGANTQSVRSSNAVEGILVGLTQPAFASENRNFTIGTNFGGPNPNTFNGYIGEILMYSKALSTVETNILLSYVTKKWGIVAL